MQSHRDYLTEEELMKEIELEERAKARRPQKNARKYQKAPTSAIFEDIKKNVLRILQNTPTEYARLKKSEIQNLDNVNGNAWLMIEMFDRETREKLSTMVRAETADQIKKRYPL